MGSTCSTTKTLEDLNQEITNENERKIEELRYYEELRKYVEKIYSNEYVLFLSGTFEGKFLCVVNNLYNFFNKNKISYLAHNEKYLIIQIIKAINQSSPKGVYFYNNTFLRNL